MNLREKLTPIAQQDPNLLLEEVENNQKMVIYQIFTRLFGNTNSSNIKYGTVEENGVGKFNHINEAALQNLKGMGITHIWYTGVIEHAVLTDFTAYGIPLDDADVVKGRAGSPYAIKDYYDVNPDLAENISQRMEEFEALVQRTHDEGMKVFIDFVPNHVARQYASDAMPEGVQDFGARDDTGKAFDPNNNFYYIPGQAFQVPPEYTSLGEHSFPTKDGKFDENPAKATGNDQFTATPTVNDWFETVKLNYGIDYQNNRQTYFDPIPNTWLKMRDILLFWAGKSVDGFRCDMAEMVPVEFWHWVIPTVKEQYPELTFIAEIYNPEQYRNYIDHGRFDFLYDKVQLYDTLRAVVEERSDLRHVTEIWQYLRGKNHHMLRFLENHDEQRIASRFFAGSPEKAKPALVVSALLHTGPIMIYFGQEVGEPAEEESGFSSDDGRTTIFDYWGVPEHQKWSNGLAYDGGKLSESQLALRAYHSKVLQLSHKPVIAEGYFYDLHPHNRYFTQGYHDKVYAFLRFNTEQKLLIVTNFDANNSQQFNLKIPSTALEAIGLSQNESYTLKDLLMTNTQLQMDAGAVVISEGEAGLPIHLEPLQSFVFSIE
ncbi:alpha-amylase family glycosyl hydrolase [Catalinimonas niigatensis]|uniref:alpha-amylase family glycosyl hydrolase n=1 Tax=Catalinimonas niigatensis TaxID=1397264 RepID=UPI002664F83A|nr:alpha-amylase family glycosyl hydrolase [Catalinimonas niigatensis]WPP52353.1 alpha-amylase family glycosyl hydrolase [Catalinimonas niigatensis]